MRINNVYEKVLQVLEKEPDTRNDDTLLYSRICKIYYGKDIMYYKFLKVLVLQKTGEIPNMNTVQRARRKAQQKFEKLRATKLTKEKRNELEKEFVEFGRR